MDRFEENGMKMNHIEEHLEKDRKTKRKFENYPCPSSSILLSNLTNSRVFAPKNKPNEGRIGEETNKNTLDKNSLDTPPQQRQRERRINSSWQKVDPTKEWRSSRISKLPSLHIARYEIHLDLCLNKKRKIVNRTNSRASSQRSRRIE